jgi:hypothetical protein
MAGSAVAAKAILRRARARLALGFLQDAEGDVTAAGGDVGLRKDIDEVRGNEALIEGAVGMLGEGEFDDAIGVLVEAGARAERCGASEQLGHVVSYLGIAKMHMLDWSGAAECHKRHMELCLEVGDLEGRTRALGNLGSCFEMQGIHQDAVKCHREQVPWTLDP